jgi:hypothetical protein
MPLKWYMVCTGRPWTVDIASEMETIYLLASLLTDLDSYAAEFCICRRHVRLCIDYSHE